MVHSVASIGRFIRAATSMATSSAFLEKSSGLPPGPRASLLAQYSIRSTIPVWSSALMHCLASLSGTGASASISSRARASSRATGSCALAAMDLKCADPT